MHVKNVRYHKPPEHAPGPQDATKLPVDRPIAVYYRQSSTGQVGNVSTMMQRVDLPAYVEQLGWQPSSIILIDEDAGISGTTAPDERDGMARVLDLVEHGGIGAIACVHVDRLFRDRHLRYAGAFVEACLAARVIVVVPDNAPYVFHDPYAGDYHVDRFLRDAQAAGKFIYEHIQKKLRGAIQRNLQAGLWSGSSITPGYMARITQGRSGVYEPFDPVAKVIGEYFKLFVQEYRGNLYATARHIRLHGPDFPDWDSPEIRALVPEGCVMRRPAHLVRKSGGRYYPNESSLRLMLTNAAYIGHWAIKGVIVKWNNHPPIVPLDLFMAAFNYLSPVTLTGDPNPDYCPRTSRSRKADKPRPPRPFLEGMLKTCDQQGKPQMVGTSWSAFSQVYLYSAVTPGEHTLRKKLWTKQAHLIDQVVMDRLSTRLSTTLAQGDAEKLLASLRKDFSEERRRLDRDMKNVERRKRDIVENLTHIKKTPNLVTDLEEQYQALEAEKKRLEGKHALLDAQEAQQTGARKLLDNLRLWVFRNAILVKPEISDTDWRKIIPVCIRSIEVALDRHDLVLTIIYNDGASEVCALPRKDRGWTNEERARLVELVEGGADQETIAQALPDRRWHEIQFNYKKFTGKPLMVSPKPIHNTETWERYCWRREAEVYDCDETIQLDDAQFQSGLSVHHTASARHDHRAAAVVRAVQR